MAEIIRRLPLCALEPKNKRLRIVVLADSMAMPRIEEGCTIYWENTWPYLLRERLVRDGIDAEVINCATRNRTVDTLVGLDFVEHVVWKRPDVVILQVGIVDCAPRVFSRREKKWLNYAVVPKRLRDWLVAYRSARRAQIIQRDALAKVDTPPGEFRDYLSRFISKLHEFNAGIRLVILPIMANEPFMETRSPGYSRNVQLYNDMIRSCTGALGATLISPSDIIGGRHLNELFCADGYHFNEEGLKRTAESLHAALYPPQNNSIEEKFHGNKPN